MPLDHYVPQVHLKNFYSPALGKLMHAVRKSDGKRFPCQAADVCRREDGNTNGYLTEPRAIEAYLKTIEPKYNVSVQKLREQSLDAEAIRVLAGFTAYVASCSPTAMRLGAANLKATVELTTKRAERMGLLDDVGPLPPSLGASTITELIEKGAVIAKIDEKYPQAMGIDAILEHASRFGNCHWEVLSNAWAESPYFTSDYPTAMEDSPDPRVQNRVVPLAPDLALRIWPDLAFRGKPTNNFSANTVEYRAATRNEVRRINETIVRSAEDNVFYRDDLPWVT